MDDRSNKPRWVRLLVLGLLGGLLVWAIVSTTLVSYLAVKTPEAALTLDGSQSRALLGLAQQKLDARFAGGAVAPRSHVARSLAEPRDVTAATFGRLSGWAKAADGAVALRTDEEERAVVASADKERAGEAPFELSADDKLVCDDVRALALAVLAKEPNNARAYRILGQVASQVGDDAQAEQFMKAAVQRSLREPVAVHWLMRRAVDAKDHDAAVGHIDLILRTFPQLRDAVLPTFVQIAESPDGSAAVKAALGRNPPWRAGVLWHLPSVVTDARTPLALLMHLKGTPHPPTPVEIAAYLNFLIGKKFYDLAYDTWLQFLPDEQLGAAGNVYNGRFQFPSSGLAFDWNIAAKSGVTAEIVSQPDVKDGKVLSVEFSSGQVDFPGVTQMTLLRSGSYEFKGRFKGSLVGRRGLRWRVVCLEQPTVRIAESSMFLSGSSTWQPFAFAFRVDANECRAQVIKLELDARSASERLVTGTMMFGDIEIARVNASVGTVPGGDAPTAGKP